jgi:hypothetical protein
MIRLAYGPHSLQFGDLRLPAGKGPHPVAVVIHGGFWRAAFGLENIAPLCEALTAVGIATWNLEYRRVGNGGGWPVTLKTSPRALSSFLSLQSFIRWIPPE